jgi:hypothetical protein
MRGALMTTILLAAAPAMAQSLPSIPRLPSAPSAPSSPSIPGFGGSGSSVPGASTLTQQTPDQRRAFCQRVGAAAQRCGTSLDVTALSSCVVRSLPTEDSMRVAQAANNARGDASSVLSECGVSAR